MKRLNVSIITVFLVCSMLLFPATVLADDPPDSTNVSVTVISEGDIDANIDLQGNNLNVLVNGDELANQGDIARLDRDTGSFLGGLYQDVADIKVIIKDITLTLNQDNKSQDEIISLYGDAIAKLIVSLQTLQCDLARLSASQYSIQVSTWESLDELSKALDDLLVQMNGVISNITITEADLLTRLENNSNDIELLKSEYPELRQKYSKLSESTSNRTTLLTIGFALVFCGLVFPTIKVLLIGRRGRR